MESATGEKCLHSTAAAAAAAVEEPLMLSVENCSEIYGNVSVAMETANVICIGHAPQLSNQVSLGSGCKIVPNSSLGVRNIGRREIDLNSYWFSSKNIYCMVLIIWATNSHEPHVRIIT